MELRKLREAARQIALAAIDAVDPHTLAREALRLEGGLLRIADTTVDLALFKKILVVGAGKGDAPMAAAVEDVLGDRIAQGVIVVKDGHTGPLDQIKVIEAGHPVPDRRGVEAARDIVSLLRENAAPDTLVLCLISGGGSALMPLPQEPVSLRDKQKTTNLLLKCGATIDEINTVRKHISMIKGGRMAGAAFPSRVVCMILSDVIGDPLDTIASGPTVGDPSTFADCLRILESHNIWRETPQSVREIVERGMRGDIPETPKPVDPVFANVSNIIIGNNHTALEAARSRAFDLGFNTRILSDSIQGEARDVGTMLAKEILSARSPEALVRPPACILAGGETTVTIRGGGKGGRNQELALSASLRLAGESDTVVAAVGTDGTDGPTDAAGAIVDSTTTARAKSKGLDPLEHLDNNDSYNLLGPIDDLLKTGPTGTNVMDILVALAG